MQNLKNSLCEEKIRKNLNTAVLGKDLHMFESVTSTFDASDSLNLAHGTLILAKKQTNGRGREKRCWSSPLGGIYFSLILDAKKGNVQTYTSICALAVQKAIDKIVPCLIKWPNDIITENGKKICGILAKARFSGGKADFINVGVGINANSSVFSENLPYAVSISDAIGFEIDENALLCDILLNIEKCFLQDEKILKKEFEKVCKTLGSFVKIIYPDKREIKGKCTKITDDFELVLMSETCEELIINSGEASVRGIYGENYV